MKRTHEMADENSSIRRRAYGYARVSTAEQVQHQTSLRQQRVDLKAYCDKQSIDLIEVFSEPGLSGSDWKRPEFNRMMAGILSRPHYLGRFVGNKADEFGNVLPEEDWTWVECPLLITQEQFDRVAALREKRAPRNTPARVVSGPTLLIGLAQCGGCSAGMTIRTGKGGRYRYYSCHSKVNRGASSCGCPMFVPKSWILW